MIYRIADFNFKISFLSPYVQEQCRDFLVDENAAVDAELTVDECDIEYEKQFSESLNVFAKREMYESFAFFRKISAFVLQHDAFLMHGVVAEYENVGYMFTARSGTGKTTHIRQWKQAFGDENVTIVNGDKPIIRFIDGKVYAYGTPWNGKEHYGTTGRTELKALCFVERALDNSIARVSADEAIPRLLGQIMIRDSTNLAKQLELIDLFLQKVPTYNIKCTISPEAAKVAYEGMNV